MDFGSLVSDIGGYAQQASQIAQVVSNRPAPVAVSAPAAVVMPRSGSMAEGAGMTLGGIAIVYFVLRFLGLLPRWARII